MTNASELLEGTTDPDLVQMKAMVRELAAIADMAAGADMENDDGSATDRLCAIASYFGIEETDWTHGDLAGAINVETARLYRAQVTQLEAQLAEVREGLRDAEGLLAARGIDFDNPARKRLRALLTQSKEPK